MDRRIQVQVNRSTWPLPPALPSYPMSFPSNARDEDFSIPALLLMIGFLTTPPHSSGVSLSDYWAWVRYLSAISADTDLRLTKAFSDLDAHQKTILSDDFGMGVPMFWLQKHLNLSLICDGRYFIERMAASVGAISAKTGKRGPNKSPDFVAKDINGVWHVVECKGTQSGSGYGDRQLGDTGPPPTGAIAQKKTIMFPPSYSGQRLACGLSIAVESGREPSVLKVIDPPAQTELSVGIDHLDYADDAILRAITAKSLRIAGFEATSSVIAAPDGIAPSSRPGSGRAEARRRLIVEEKQARSRQELEERGSRTNYTEMGEQFFGREVRFDLRAPLVVDDRTVRAVRIRQGVNSAILAELAGEQVDEQPFAAASMRWRESLDQMRVQSSQLGASLHIGSMLLSEMELEE